MLTTQTIPLIFSYGENVLLLSEDPKSIGYELLTVKQIKQTLGLVSYVLKGKINGAEVEVEAPSSRVYLSTNLTLVPSRDNQVWSLKEKCFGVTVTDLNTSTNSIWVKLNGSEQSKSIFANDLLVLKQFNAEPKSPSYSSLPINRAYVSGYTPSERTGEKLIDDHKFSDMILFSVVGGENYCSKLTQNEVAKAVQVLDWDKFTITYNDKEKEVIRFHLKPENCAWKTVSKSVLCCAYDATKTYLQTFGLGSLDSDDKNWYSCHPKVEDKGLPFPYTITVLNDLVAPYGIGISHVYMKQGISTYDETEVWEKILGVNPACAINKNTSNAQYQAMLGGPEAALQMGFDPINHKFEYVDQLPKDTSVVSMATLGSGSIVSFAGGGGHATFRGPRASNFNWSIAVRFDRIENCNRFAEVPVQDYQAQINTILDLRLTKDKEGKTLVSSIYNNTSPAEVLKGIYWEFPSSSYSSSSHSYSPRDDYWSDTDYDAIPKNTQSAYKSNNHSKPKPPKHEKKSRGLFEAATTTVTGEVKNSLSDLFLDVEVEALNALTKAATRVDFKEIGPNSFKIKRSHIVRQSTLTGSLMSRVLKAWRFDIRDLENVPFSELKTDPNLIDVILESFHLMVEEVQVTRFNYPLTQKLSNLTSLESGFYSFDRALEIAEVDTADISDIINNCNPFINKLNALSIGELILLMHKIAINETYFDIEFLLLQYLVNASIHSPTV